MVSLDGQCRWRIGGNPCVISAPGMIRTCDTRFRKPMLYPLSYGGSGCKGAGQRVLLLAAPGPLTTPVGRLTAKLTA